MNKKFIFESESVLSPKDPEYCAHLEVSFSVEAQNEDEAWATELCVWDLDRDCEVSLEKLTERERTQIEERAQSIADSCAYEAWCDYQTGRAESLADSYKDGTYDD